MKEQNRPRLRPTRHALVVDPAELSRAVIGHALSSIEIDATTFADAAPALSWLEANAVPDIVIVSEDAGAVVDAMRASPAFARVPVVIVTPPSGSFTVRAAQANVRYVEQPVRRAALLVCVEQCLNEASAVASPTREMSPVTAAADPLKTTTPGRRVPSVVAALSVVTRRHHRAALGIVTPACVTARERDAPPPTGGRR
jgi:CheY-like chemotaxis protein